MTYQRRAGKAWELVRERWANKPPESGFLTVDALDFIVDDLEALAADNQELRDRAAKLELGQDHHMAGGALVLAGSNILNAQRLEEMIKTLEARVSLLREDHDKLLVYISEAKK